MAAAHYESPRHTRALPVPRVPHAPQAGIGRQRISQRIAEAFESSSVVEILAAGGWGKTTAAWQYAQSQERTVVWHTVGQRAGSELDLLFHDCAAAWLRDDGSVMPPASDGTEADATGVTAFHVTDGLEGTGRRYLLVLDDAQNVRRDPTALGELETLLGNLPLGLSVLLVTRDNLSNTVRGTARMHGYAVLTETDLRLSAREAAELRTASGAVSTMDAAELLRQTGGWIAGAALFTRFEAGDNRLYDILFEYIESEVVGPLTAEEQNFLRRTSILSQVTLDEARVLVGDSAEAAWLRLRGRVLPLTGSNDSELSYRAPLRGYLQDRLAREDPGALPRLRASYLKHLVAVERFQDAIDWCIAMGDMAQAVRLIERTVTRLPDKTPPWSEIASWMHRLGEGTLLASDILAGTIIRVLHHDKRLDEATSLILELRHDDRMDAILSADPSLTPIVLWCLHRRPDDAFGFIHKARGRGYRIEAIGYMLAATAGTKPAEPPIAATWGEMATVVHWGMIWQGRLNEVIDTATDSPHAFEDNANLVLAALWANHPELADHAWNHVPEPRRQRPHAVFAEAAICLFEGAYADGLRLLRDSMDAAHRTMAAADFEVLIAYITLKQGAPRKAIDLLEARMPEILQHDRLAISEWAQFVLALAYLNVGDPERASELLAECTRTMEKAGRHLLLRAAYRAHADAALRLGDPKRAESLLTSLPPTRPGAPGSPYWEAEVGAWCTETHDRDSSGAATLRLPGMARLSIESSGRSAYLNTFGDPAVLAVDGEVNALRRTKLVELIADLAVHGGATDRVALQQRMFPDADRRHAGNHFRQVLFKLRELTDVTLDRPTNDTVRWPAEIKLTATDIEFQQRIELLLKHPEQAGTDLDALRAVLDLASGTYLPASELEWVAERRNHLSMLYEEGVTFLLNWAFDNEHLDLIREYGARATQVNPYTEHLYLLMMKAELRWGQPARARAAYRRAYDALRELGLEPSVEMRHLAQSHAGS